MIRRFAVMAVAAVSLVMAADAAVTSVAMRGMAPTGEGGFQLRQTTVQYNKLDLSNKQGASKLLALLHKAAAATCETDAIPTERVKTEVKECRSKAMKQAIARVHSPELTMVASAK